MKRARLVNGPTRTVASVLAASALILMQLVGLGVSAANATAVNSTTVPDAAFRKCLTDQGITDLESVTGTLYCDGRGIVSLQGAQYLTGISGMYFNDNKVADLSPLKDLTQLTSLEFRDNAVANLSPLAKLTNLTTIDFSQTDTRMPGSISDLTPLANLTQLTTANFNKNAITDFSPLRDGLVPSATGQVAQLTIGLGETLGSMVFEDVQGALFPSYLSMSYDSEMMGYSNDGQRGVCKPSSTSTGCIKIADIQPVNVFSAAVAGMAPFTNSTTHVLTPPLPGRWYIHFKSADDSQWGFAVVTVKGYSLEKNPPVAPGLVVGQVSAYRFTVTNHTNMDSGAGTVQFRDQLPVNVEFQPTPGCVLISGTVATGQLIECTVPTNIPKLGGTASLTVNVKPLAAVTDKAVINKAVVDIDGPGMTFNGTTYNQTFTSPGINAATAPPYEGMPGGCTGEEKPHLGCAYDNSTVTAPKLTLKKENDPSGYKVGVPAIYKLTVTNTGTADATSFTIADILPTQFTYVDTPGCTQNATTKVITCTINQTVTKGGGTAVLNLNVLPNAVGATLTNKAIVDPTGGTTPGAPGDCTGAATPNAGCATVTSSITAVPVLSLTKTNPSTGLTVGVNSTYDFTVKNTGAAAVAANSAVVVDKLPAGVEYVSASGAACTATPSPANGAAQTLNCTVAGSLAATTGSTTFSVTVKPTQAVSGASIVNKAIVDADGPGGNAIGDPTNCTATGTPAGCAVTTPVTVAGAPVITGPTNNLITNDNTQTITGTGAAGFDLTVTLVDANDNTKTYTCKTVVKADGSWTCDTSALPDGKYTYSATQSPANDASIVSPKSNTQTLTVDTVNPAIALTKDSGLPGTTITLGSVTDPAFSSNIDRATLTITGLPADWSYQCVPAVPADPTKCTIQVTVPAGAVPGSYPMDISIKDKAGNTGTVTAAPFTVNGAPVITGPTNNLVTNDNTQTITGTGSAGFDLTVTLVDANDNTKTYVCKTVVETDGSWTCDTSALPDGKYTYSATQSPADDATSVSPKSNIQTMTVDTTKPVVTLTPEKSPAGTTIKIGSVNDPNFSAGLKLDSLDITGLPAGATWECLATSTVPDAPITDCDVYVTLPAGAEAKDYSITVTITDNAGNTGSATQTFTVAAPKLSLKKDGPTEVSVGTNYDYTLTVTNDGTWDAASTTVKDLLPDGVTLVSTSLGSKCTAVGQLVTCTIDGPIAPGASNAKSFTIKVTPKHDAIKSKVINYAIVDVDGPGGTDIGTPGTCKPAPATPGCATSPEATITGVALSLTKTNPGSFTVGKAADYTFVITNVGNVDMASTAVQFTDKLDPYVKFNSASGATCTVRDNSDAALKAGWILDCTYTVALAAGASSPAFTINVTPQAAASGTRVDNHAAVSVDGTLPPGDPSACTIASSPISGCAVTPDIPVDNGVALKLKKEGPPTMTVGTNATYTFTVTNTGSGDSAKATVVDTLPTGLTFVSSTLANDGCQANGQVVTCTVPGPIGPGDANSKTFDITVKVTAGVGATVTNYAGVDPKGGTNPPTDAKCQDDLRTPGCAVSPDATVDRGIDLSLAKSGPSTMTVGVESIYTFTVSNNGTGDAAKATVVDQLPDGMTFVSASDATCVDSGTLVTCTVAGPIAAKSGSTPGQVTFTMKVMPTKAGTGVKNRARVDTKGGTGPVDPTECTDTNVPAGSGCAVSNPTDIGNGVDLRLSKTGPTNMLVGDTAPYTLTITNVGTGPAATATVKDLLPTGLEFVTASLPNNGCTANGQLVTCTVPGPIAANGGKAIFTITVKALGDGATNPKPIATGPVANKAAVDPDGGTDPVDPGACKTTGTPDGCAVSPDTTVTQAPYIDLVLEIKPPSTLTVGEQSAYDVKVTNHGTMDSPNGGTVEITIPKGLQFDGLPKGTTGVTCSTATGPGSANLTVVCTITAPIKAADPNSTADEFPFQLLVTPLPVLGGGSATVPGAVDTDGGSAPFTSTDCKGQGSPSAGCSVAGPTPVGTGIDLTLEKDGPTTMTVGVPATYTFTVTNNGTGPASLATVRDTLPVGLHLTGATPAACSIKDGTTSLTGEQITCTLTGEIQPGVANARTFTMTVMPMPNAANTKVTNHAAVDPTGGTNPVDPGSCTANANPAGCALSPEATVNNGVNLSLSKTGPTQLNLSGTGTYLVTVKNSGTGPAASATIEDLLPAGMSFVPNSADGAACAASGQVVTCTVNGPIAPVTNGKPGEKSFTFKVTVADATVGDELINQAAVDTDGGSDPVDPTTCTKTGTPAGCAVSPETQIVADPAPDLILNLDPPTGNTMVVGVESTYDVTVTNLGNATATGGSTIEITLPAGLDFKGVIQDVGGTPVSCEPTGDAGVGIKLTCATADPLLPNDTNHFQIKVEPLPELGDKTVTVPGAVDTKGGSAPFTSTDCTDQGTPNTGCDVAGPTPIGNGIDLSLAKSNPDAIVVGKPATYTLKVTNNGTGPAATATVKDLLPTGLTYVSSPGDICAPDAQNAQLLTCTVPGPIKAKKDAPANVATFTITVKADATLKDKSVTNRASVDTDGGTEPTPPGNCDATGTPAGCAVTDPTPVTFVDLVVTITEPTKLVVGETSTYDVVVENKGTAPAPDGGTVVIELPKGIDYVGVTPGGPLAEGDCEATGTAASGITVTCTVPGPIAKNGDNGDKVEFGIDVMPVPSAAGETVKVPAAVEPTGGTTPVDPSTCVAQANHPRSCDETGPVTIGNGVNLSLVKQAPATIVVGETGVYTLTITNNGTGPATNATVKDLLPEGMEYVSSSGDVCGKAPQGQSLTCTVPGPIEAAKDAPANVVSFTITVEALASGAGKTVKNLASVDTDGGSDPVNPGTCTNQPKPAGCAVSDPTEITYIDLVVTIDEPTKLTVGETSTYDVTVTNEGTKASPDGGTVVVELPKGIDYVGVTPGGPLVDADCKATGTAATGITVTCTVPGPIAENGGKVDFGIDVKPIPGTDGETVKVPAAVDPTGGTTPVDPSTCVAQANHPKSCDESGPVTIGNGVNLTLTKTNPARLAVDTVSSYTLTVTNLGTGPAKSATVLDQLDPKIEFVSATGADCKASGTAAVGQRVTCTVPGPIAENGGKATFTIQVKPQLGAAPADNRASVDTDGGTTPVDPSICVATGGGCAVTPEIPVAFVELVVDITEPATLTVGETASYDVTVTNVGTKSSPDGGTVVVELPKGLDFVGVTPGGQAGVDCKATGTAATGITVTCSVPGPIAENGGKVDFGIDVKPLPGTDGETVKVPTAVDPTGGTTPVDPSTCVAQANHPKSCDESGPVTIGNGVNLTLTKTNPASLEIGKTSSYSFVVTNNGTGPAKAATIADHLAPYVEYVSATGATCSASGKLADGQRVTCTVSGPIAAGGGTAEFTMAVKPSWQTGGASVRNLATVDVNGDGAPGNPDLCPLPMARAAATMPARAIIDPGCAVTPPLEIAKGKSAMTLDKRVAKSTYTVGDTIEYTITFGNTGTAEATAQLHDPMPDTVKTSSVTCKTSSDGTCKGWISKNEVYGSVLVTPGETVTFTVLGKVVGAGSVKNIAVITPTGPQCPPAGCKPQSAGSAAAAAKPPKSVGKPPKGGFLPSTGATAAWWSVPAGAGLLLAGAAAVVIGRRRRG